jgi:DNA-directed RNA polymerase alpha subunit
MRKAIQIIHSSELTALCDDGSVWRLVNDEWLIIQKIPLNNMPDSEILVDDLELSIRVLNVLKANGILKLSELLNKRRADLATMPFLGKKSLMDVIDTVHYLGYELMP